MTLDGSVGVRMRLGVRGMGMPDVSLQWFDGAGDGSTFRGARTLPRALDLPVKIEGEDRADVLAKFSALARILRAPLVARLTAKFDSDRYRLDVVRTGGGDFEIGVDSDGKTILMTVITVIAGSPFWEQIDSEGREIKPEGVGKGLLAAGQSLVQLVLGSVDGLGDVSFQNTGDVDAWPTWTVTAPFTGFAFVRSDGLALEWEGVTTKSTGFIRVDTLAGTVVDETGANRYAELLPAPKFFSIPPGGSGASIVISDASSASRVAVNWHPRKLVMF